MAPHIPTMRNNIAKALNTAIDNINVKATTEEGLGFTGAKEGIAAQSVCLLFKLTSKLNNIIFVIKKWNIVITILNTI